MGSLLPLYLFLLLLSRLTSKSFSLCNPHETSALLQFKNSFFVNTSSKPNQFQTPRCSSFSFKTESWINSKDCCDWDGVTCDHNVSNHVTGLDLTCNNLKGELHPNSTVFQLRHLQQLNLAFNDFSMSSLHVGVGDLVNLTHLNLSYCDLTGNIPLSLWNLTQLTFLDLDGNNLKGEIPDVFGSLIKLEYLSLSDNNLVGQVPLSLFLLPQLYHLQLSSNKFVGPIPSEITKHSKLRILRLSENMLNGTIPHWCYHLPSLLYLDLKDNHLTGFIEDFSTYSLIFLFLSNNNLHGHFPNSIFKLQNLIYLELSSTNLSGVVDFHQFSTFKYLYLLNLSNNSALSINIDGKAQTISPYLKYLYLSSTNINNFPNFLPPFPNLEILDLSNNNIHGKIPKWFGKHLLYSWKNILLIDLSFNKLQGDLPIPPYGIVFLLLSNNNFTGDIDLSLCNASSLRLLNLAHNNLTGTIPQCLGTFPSLLTLDVQKNNLYGSIPTIFSEENQFETIKLNGNQLDGPLPRSLAHCTKLEILDLGNNNIDDTFPMWLGTLPELQVLSLRSNKFHGTITHTNIEHSFPKLRIFDISDNYFSGPLPISLLKNFQGMMNVSYNTGLQYMMKNSYYNDSVVVIMKGFSFELIGILTTFTTIDLSNNKFEGEIPHVIGELISLKGLNLSNNKITGNIPQSLSDLRNLEWLDLSWNQLRGEIPITLTNLNFLSFLNLSHNHLEGMIPKGKQFDTFENNSYDGNAMLCGFPLSKSCKSDEDQPPHSTLEDEEESGFGWKAVVTGYVCGAIFGLLFGYNVFFIGKPVWLVRFFEHMFNVRLKRTRNRANANSRRMN